MVIEHIMLDPQEYKIREYVRYKALLTIKMKEKVSALLLNDCILGLSNKINIEILVRAIETF